MILKKLYVLIIFLLAFVYVLNCETPTEISDTENITTSPEEEIDIDADPDFIDDEEYDDEESTPESLRELRRSRTFDFTKDDVINFAENNKNSLVYAEPYYTKSFHDILSINNVKLTLLKLPVNHFTNRLTNLGNIDKNRFQRAYYPYEATLTRLYAGLGDFDKEFANVSVYKNELASIKGLHFRGDFKGTNEIKEDLTLRSLDFYLQFDYSNADWRFNTTYLNGNRDLITKYLFFSDNPYVTEDIINHNWQFFNIEIGWNYITAGYFSSENSLDTVNVSEIIDFNTSGYLLGTNFNNGYNNLSIFYQRNNHKNNDISFYENTAHITCNLSLWKIHLDYDYLLYNDFKNEYLNGNLLFDLNKNISLLTTYRYFDLFFPRIRFLSTNHLVYYLKEGIVLNFNEPNNNIRTTSNLMVGQKEVTHDNINGSLGDKFLTVSSEIDLDIVYNDYLLNIKNNFEYDNITENFILYPKMQNSLDISLTRNFINDNQITIGAKINYISDITNERDIKIISNPYFDTYFSLGITKLFDIKLEFNNLNRNWNYGNNVMNDFHISSYLVWYFLN